MCGHNHIQRIVKCSLRKYIQELFQPPRMECGVCGSYPTHFCLPQKDLKLKVTQHLSSISRQVGGKSKKEMTRL